MPRYLISGNSKKADCMHKRPAQVVAGDAPRGADAIYNLDLAPIDVRRPQQKPALHLSLLPHSSINQDCHLICNYTML